MVTERVIIYKPWLVVFKARIKKMTTQIQKEYIKTVNCQKTSLDVLGRDSWTISGQTAEMGRQGQVLVTLNGQ